MPIGDYNPTPKPSHKRNKPTAKQRGEISTSVRNKVNERSNNRCERCGKHRSKVWTLENAHIIRRNDIEEKTTEDDLIRLCGPSTLTGTCHWWADNTREGKNWLRGLRGLEPIKERKK